MLRVAVLVSLLLAVHAWEWDLTTTHSDIKPGLTENVELKCHHDDNTTHEDHAMYLAYFSICKLNNQGDFCEPIAVISAHMGTMNVQNNPNINVAGTMEPPVEDAFLKVTWPAATRETAGKYECAVVGVHPDYGYREMKSSVVEITAVKSTTDDVAAQMMRLKKTQENILHKLNSHFDQRYWPLGPFALLGANSACPDTPYSSMSNGSIKYTIGRTQSVPKHNISNPSHLHNEMFVQYDQTNDISHLKFSFCVKESSDNDQMIKWPKGNYCIHTGLGADCTQCPSNNFTASILTFDLGDTATMPPVGSAAPFPGHQDGKANLEFCCRKDGSADVPIFLPPEKPFFLYRVGGKCQQVMGMAVTDEWFTIDTPAYMSSSSPIVPDGGDKDRLRLELCYYTPSQ